jgi:hypothetical protein
MNTRLDSKSLFLDHLVTPKLAVLGLQWRNDNSWVEPGDIAVRRIVRFVSLKGNTAVIEWGLSMNFVPHFSGRRLVFHRTFQSARFDLFESPKSYRDSFSGSIPFMKIDCQNEFFRDSLESYLRTIVPELMSWFDRVYSIETIERELDEQRHSPEWCYRIHYPSPRFVLAFLKSAKGDISAAKQLLSDSLYSIWDAEQVAALQFALAKVPPM